MMPLQIIALVKCELRIVQASCKFVMLRHSLDRDGWVDAQK